MWRQRLQRGNDIALLRRLLLVFPEQVLHGPLCRRRNTVLHAEVGRDVHGQLAVLHLLSDSVLQHDTCVHLHHAHVQHAVDPGQLSVFGLAEVQGTHQGVFQPHLCSKEKTEDEDIEACFHAVAQLTDLDMNLNTVKEPQLTNY